ncbi:MAG: hypothetical protein HZA77_04815 [Candidatus Schekmanbacteria bacterium]|nr:hypothetical protein [Candidatus Schekmanbacteria bacterium]
MKLKDFKKLIWLILLSVLTGVGMLIAAAPSDAAKKSENLLFRVGENSLSIGSLGGEVAISDPTNPLYGAGISFGASDFLGNKNTGSLDDRSFTLYQIDNAIKIKKDKDGNPRILEVMPSKNTTSILMGTVAFKPKKKKGTIFKDIVFPSENTYASMITANEQHDNIIVLHIDTDGVQDKYGVLHGEKFPTYFIKDVKFKNYKLSKAYGAKGVYFKNIRLPVFTTSADLPENLPNGAQVVLIQVLQVPRVSVSLNAPSNFKAKNSPVVAVGPAVTFSATNTLLGVSNNPTAPGSFAGTIEVPYYTGVVSALGINIDDLLLYKQNGKNFEPVITATISNNLDTATISAKNLVEVEVITTGEDVVTKTKTYSLDFGTYLVVAPSSSETNSLPAILSLSAENKKSGKVEIKYILSDAESDPCDVKIEYRKSPVTDNTGWTEIETLTGVKPNSKKSKTFTWDSSADLSDFTGFLQVRVTPSQQIDSTSVNGAWRVSSTFSVDNGGITISAPTGLKGTVVNFVEDVISNDIDTPPQVVLNWNAVDTASGYNIYRQARFKNGIEDALKVIKTIDSSATTTFTDSKDNGTLDAAFFEAFYSITAFDAEGNESKYAKKLHVASIVFGSYGYYGTE